MGVVYQVLSLGQCSSFPGAVTCLERECVCVSVCYEHCHSAHSLPFRSRRMSVAKFCQFVSGIVVIIMSNNLLERISGG